MVTLAGIPRVPNRRKLQGWRLNANSGGAFDKRCNNRGHQNADGTDEGRKLQAGLREVHPPQPRALSNGASRAKRRPLSRHPRAELTERNGADKQRRARVGVSLLPGERVCVVPRHGDLRRFPNDRPHRKRPADGDYCGHFCVAMHSYEREGFRAVQVQVASGARPCRTQTAFQRGLVQGNRRSHAGFPSELPAAVIFIFLRIPCFLSLSIRIIYFVCMLRYSDVFRVFCTGSTKY